MSEALNEEILQLLSAYSEPLTTSFISFNLAGYSFSEVCGALSDLQGAGLVSLDSFGYQLVEQEPPATPDEPQLVPNQPDEQLAELPTEKTTSAPRPTEALAPEAETVPAAEEPLAQEDPLPPISFDTGGKFQLDSRLVELLGDSTGEASEEMPVSPDAPTPTDEIEQSTEPERESPHQDIDETPFSDEPMIGDTRDTYTASSVDEEYRMMLEKFASEAVSDSTLAPSTLPSSRSTQEEDEYRDLLERLLDASTDSDGTVPTPVAMNDENPQPDTQESVLTYDMLVSAFGFSNRATNILSKREIITVEDLVKNISTITNIPGAGQKSLTEISRGLEDHAIEFPMELEDEQIEALGQASGSHQYIFDFYGRLCRIPRSALSDAEKVPDLSSNDHRVVTTLNQTVADIPLQSQDLPTRLVKALARQGIKTVGQAAQLSEEELLAIRGVGILAVTRLSDLLLELGVTSTASPEEEAEQPEASQEPLDTPLLTDPSATEGARLALAIGKERSYRLFDKPFLICMPRAAEQIIGPGCTPEAYCDAVIDLIEDSDVLLASCQDHLAAKVELAMQLVHAFTFIEEVTVPPHPQWEKAAQRFVETDRRCHYDPENHVIRIKHPHLMDWIESSDLDERTRAILYNYLAGATLESCGNDTGLTRERIRQIVTKTLKSAPAVDENRFRYFFETYELSKQDFLRISGEPVSTYVYLKTTKSKSTRVDDPYSSKALKDERIPQTARDGIRRIMDRGYIYADGYRIPERRDAIINHLVMRHATQHPIKLERLTELYVEFLQSHNLSNNKHFRFTNTHAFEAYINRCDQVMSLPHNTASMFEGTIRYYDAPSMDFEPLARLLASHKHDDIECSTALLMNYESFAEVLDELDIHNGYELHYVIRHYCPEIDGVTMLRSPNIIFGNGSRNDQILELIKELSPVTAQDLAATYAARYGVDQATFMGSYLTPFKIYYKNGKYLYTSEHLTSEQREFLTAQLASSGSYMSVALLRARFKDRFPSASVSLVNEENLTELGYHPSTGLLVRDGVDEREHFGSLLDKQQRFSIDDEGFGKDVFDNPSFKAELSIRERSFSLVEFERDCYLSSNVFSALDEPISRDDLRDYVEQAITFMAPDTPYTVKSLVSSGFTHKIDVLRDDFGLSDFFFSSLLRTGSVRGRLKLTSVGEVAAFCKTRYSYSAPVMLEQIVNSINAIEVDDLKYLLSDTYGIEVTNALIRTYIKRSDLYFNESLDMVFDTPETYKRKAQEWIS